MEELPLINAVKDHLMKTDGVMIGRSIYHSPYMLASIEKEIFNNNNVLSREEVIKKLIPYVKNELKKGTRLNQIMRYTLGLFHGKTGSSFWKRYLSENMCVKRYADVKKIDHIIDKVKLAPQSHTVGWFERLNFLSEYFYFFVLMLITAVPVGFFAGLFGIGGG